MRLITIAKIGAPPSLRSSRLTEVITRAGVHRFDGLRTRSGSRNRAARAPVLISQKPHERVQVSPIIRRWRCPYPALAIFGHIASSQTVCSSFERISPLSQS